MREPEKFKKIFFIICLIITTIYVGFATICSLALGGEVLNDPRNK